MEITRTGSTTARAIAMGLLGAALLLLSGIGAGAQSLGPLTIDNSSSCAVEVCGPSSPIISIRVHLVRQRPAGA